ncbi:MAG: hypothetical protein CL678_07880 [Bdellovibrionaceae bacterium]|nr:hypothetical protein [Pseudobdellovibrionaceae bacterium]
MSVDALSLIPEDEFNYTQENNTVHVSQPGNPLSTIDIEYCLLPEDNGDGGSGDGGSGDGGSGDGGSGDGGDPPCVGLECGVIGV